MGRVAVASANILPANTNQALAIISPILTRIKPNYLANVLSSERIIELIKGLKVGVAQFNLSQYHAINNDFNFERYYIDKDKFNDMKRFEVFTDDLLISCSGTMGKIAIVPPNCKKGIINQALLKLTVKPISSPNYIKIILETDTFNRND